MLGTVLDKITTLAGRAFVVSAFVPILVFAAANLVTLAAIEGLEGIERRWKALAGIQALGSITFFVAAAAAAFVLMIISPVLKRSLEDPEALPSFRRPRLRRQRQRFSRQRRAVGEALDALIETRRRRAAWQTTLIAAFTEARAPSPTATSRRSTAEMVKSADWRLSRSLAAIDLGAPPGLHALEEASDDVRILYESGRRFADAERYHRAVMDLWVDLEKSSETAYAQALADIQSRFAHGEGVAGVQSTTLGNVLASTWSYPFTRYGVDAALMWPRLQKVIPADYFRVVEDARISYDFSVNLFFLAVCYAAIWLCSGMWLRPWRPLWPVAVFPAIGALAACLFHAAAVEAARSFGAVFRTCFDLFRFKLLEELRIMLPSDIATERAVWDRIGKILIFDDHGLDLRYHHATAPERPGPVAPSG